MKKHLLCLILISCVFGFLPLRAIEQVTIDGVTYSLLSNKQAMVTNAEEEAQDIVVLAKVNYKDEDYTVTSIGPSGFFNCKSKSIILPSTITDIESTAFECCAVVNIEIPNSVETLGLKCFNSCYNLQSIVIPNSVKSIGARAFAESSKLSSAKISDAIKDIPTQCFWYCKNLEEITLPSNLETVGSSAFADCKKIKVIRLPETIKELRDNCFSYISALEEVYCSAIVPPSTDYASFRPYTNAFAGSPINNAKLHVPKNCKEIYSNTAVWQNFGTIIDDLENTTSITDIESGENAGIDYAEPFEVYNTQGQLVGDSLGEISNGLYIIRQGNKTVKKLVK